MMNLEFELSGLTRKEKQLLKNTKTLKFSI